VRRNQKKKSEVPELVSLISHGLGHPRSSGARNEMRTRLDSNLGPPCEDIYRRGFEKAHSYNRSENKGTQSDSDVLGKISTFSPIISWRTVTTLRSTYSPYTVKHILQGSRPRPRSGAAATHHMGTSNYVRPKLNHLSEGDIGFLGLWHLGETILIRSWFDGLRVNRHGSSA